MKTKKSSTKKFPSLSPAERDLQVATFGREIDLERDTKPLSAKQRADFERWQRKTPQKPYWKMTTEELAEATKEFDGPIPASRMRPLTKAEREKFDKERRGPVVNIFAKSARKREVTVKLDERTLERCEAFAAKHKLTLSQLVNLTLSSAIQFAD